MSLLSLFSVNDTILFNFLIGYVLIIIVIISQYIYYDSLL